MPTKTKEKKIDNATDWWVSRIVDQRKVDPALLTPHPMNMRRHTAKQERVMLTLLESGGVMAPIVVSERTQRVLDGHLRHALAIRHGITLLDAVFVDVDEDGELLVLATFDAVGFMAELDKGLIWSASRKAMALWDDDELAAWLSSYAPKDTSMDHAAKLIEGDDLGDGDLGGVLRQFVFQMSIEEYEAAVPALFAVMERENLSDSVDAVNWLLDRYAGNA